MTASMTPRSLPPRRRKSDVIINTVTLLDIGKAIAKYGLPTALLVPLLYFQVVETRQNQKEIAATQVSIIREQQFLAAGILKLADRVGEQHMLSEKILLVLRVSCINGSKKDDDRRECMREQ